MAGYASAMTSAPGSAAAPSATSHALGSLCWNELHTRDTARAAAFYTAVVGWKAHTCASTGGPAYTEWVTASGQHTGGMMAMPAEVPAGVPANWAVYITVANADEAAARAVKLGGRIVAPAFDVPKVGRMAAIADPQGAVVHILAPLPECKPRGPQSEPGSFCWAELLTNDPVASERFYGALFGWTVTRMPMPFGDYTLFWAAGANPESKSGCVGGMMKILPDMGPIPPNWLSYIMVDDVDAAAGRASAAGGKVCAPPTDIPGVGRFAVITDPTGATCAIFKNA